MHGNCVIKNNYGLLMVKMFSPSMAWYTVESFFSLLQRNVLNTQAWHTRTELRIAITTWIENTLINIGVVTMRQGVFLLLGDWNTVFYNEDDSGYRRSNTKEW